MTVYRSLISAYLLLIALLHTAAARPGCTTLYGIPDLTSCDELLHGSDSHIGIGNTDDKDHLFALPGTSRPYYATDEQWENKVDLPIIRSNLLCKLALIPIRSSAGDISPDASLYPAIARQGDEIQTSCVQTYNHHRPSGGFARTGNNADLLIVLYARNSDFDNSVRRKVTLNEPIFAAESANGHIIPGLADTNGDDAASSTGSMGEVSLNLINSTSLALEQQ